jgi:hypothetical protein
MVEDPAGDPFAGAGDRPTVEADALDHLLAEIEEAALSVYERHGLPTTPGDYRRGPGEDGWTFLAERLTPDEKFALALEHPREAGWRFAARNDLGAGEASVPELVQASGALSGCAWLRTRRGAAPAETLAAALKLGALWRDMTYADALQPATALTLTPVDKPARARKKSALPSPSSKSDPQP